MLSRPVVCAGVVIGLLASLHAPFGFGQQYRAVPGQYQRGVGGGQYGQQQQMQQMQQALPQPVSIDGAIATATHGTIMVADKAGRSWKVTIPATAKVEVVGTATADYLHSGLTVDFKAQFDEHGAIKDAVSELTIITPSAEDPIGIFPADSGSVPDANAAGGAGGKAAKRGASGGNKVPAKGGAVKGLPPAGSYRVVGKLTVGHGKFSVEAHGTHHFEFAVADNATVKVDLSEISFAAVGDSISVKGMAAPGKVMAGRVIPNAVGMAQATEVKITLAEPLTGTKKKAPSAKSSSQRAAKDKEDGVPPAGTEPPAGK